MPLAPLAPVATPLSLTAVRMMETLPAYYWGEPLVERIVQAWANEVDRADARLDAIMDGFVPTLATDELGLRAIWEAQLGLPVAPADASGTQRSAKIAALLHAIGSAGSAADYVDLITTAIDTGSWELLRNSPGNFQDTLMVPFDPGSYNAGQVVAIARRLHPAHRQLFVGFSDGWIIDASQIDLSVL